MNLIAPIYAAATAYRPPAAAEYEFGAATVPISELMSAPATLEVLKRKAPMIMAIISFDSIKPYLSNFTIPALVDLFKVGDTAMVASIDAALQAVPVSERPHVR